MKRWAQVGLLLVWGCGQGDAPPVMGDTGAVADTIAAPVDSSTDTDADALDAISDTAPVDAGALGIVFVRQWGGYGTEPGQFIEPSSVELDSEGYVYVAGHEDRFQKFTRDGELVAIYGSPGPGDGEFNHPHGLAIDRRRGDLVYVGDQENHRLQVFRTDGTFVRQWGDAMFQHIHDVGIDPESGDLFVGDYELDTVRRFGPTGDLLATYGGGGARPGEFSGVWGVSTDSEGFVYVADTFNRRVQKLTRDGGFVAEWDEYAGESFVKPTGVFVDARDRVHLCDSLAELVLVFDVDGNPLERWDLSMIVGLDTEPEDIVIDDDGIDIYIGEVRGHRVLQLMRETP